MRSYIQKYGWPFRVLFPKLHWKVKTNEKVIYLTFDDGPIPEITPWVLETLDKYNVKATFFMVGNNVAQNPNEFQQVVDAGHVVANHTFNHSRGKQLTVEQYLEEIAQCEQVLKGHNTKMMFRPPNGSFTKAQRKEILKKYKIIMWDLLTGDFDKNRTAEDILKTSIKLTSKGSIVLMHDSVKAWDRVRYLLPNYLEHFLAKGYKFKTL